MARYTLRGRDSGANPLVQYVTWPAESLSTPYPNSPPFGGPIVDITLLRDHGIANMSLIDTFANRPAAGVPGRRFTPSDGFCDYIDNGTVWRPVFNGRVGTAPPAAASFSKLNSPGSMTYADDKGTLLITQAETGAGANYGFGAIALPATPYVLTVGLAVDLIPANDVGYGLAIRDSATGRWLGTQLLFTSSDNRMRTQSFSSFTVSNTIHIDDGWPNAYTLASRHYLHLKDPGGSGNLEWGLSQDGTYNTLVANEKTQRNAYVANPNQLGIFTNTANVVTGRGGIVIRIFDWTVS